MPNISGMDTAYVRENPPQKMAFYKVQETLHFRYLKLLVKIHLDWTSSLISWTVPRWPCLVHSCLEIVPWARPWSFLRGLLIYSKMTGGGSHISNLLSQMSNLWVSPKDDGGDLISNLCNILKSMHDLKSMGYNKKYVDDFIHKIWLQISVICFEEVGESECFLQSWLQNVIFMADP